MVGDLPGQWVKTIRRLARAHGVTRVRLFGSRALKKRNKARDLDLLVRLKRERDLLDLIEFKLDLQSALGCRVDVVTEGALSPYLRTRILREARPL